MARNRRAKIVATLGPASSSPEMIRKLFDAGVDMFRLNFSHGTHEDHRARYDAIDKQVLAEQDQAIAAQTAAQAWSRYYAAPVSVYGSYYSGGWGHGWGTGIGYGFPGWGWGW